MSLTTKININVMHDNLKKLISNEFIDNGITYIPIYEKS